MHLVTKNNVELTLAIKCVTEPPVVVPELGVSKVIHTSQESVAPTISVA